MVRKRTFDAVRVFHPNPWLEIAAMADEIETESSEDEPERLAKAVGIVVLIALAVGAGFAIIGIYSALERSNADLTSVLAYLDSIELEKGT